MEQPNEEALIGKLSLLCFIALLIAGICMIADGFWLFMQNDSDAAVTALLGFMFLLIASVFRFSPSVKERIDRALQNFS